MSNLAQLSDAQVLLLAAHFISDVNVESLQALAGERSDVLSEDIIYRLLLTLYPTDEVARSALLALLRSVKSGWSSASVLDAPVDTTSVTRLSAEQISQEAKLLQLRTLDEESAAWSENRLSQFIITFAHLVETSAGTLQDLVALVTELAAGDGGLQQWAHAYLVPVNQIRYSFYPEDTTAASLRELQSLSGIDGVKILLQHAEARSGDADIARDLNELVVPWVMGSSPDHFTATWTHVYEWIFVTSQSDFSLASKAILRWEGPPSSTQGDDSLLDLAQTGFAIIYGSDRGLHEDSQQLVNLWQRSCSFAGLEGNIMLEEPHESYVNVSLPRTLDPSVLSGSLLLKDHPLTRVSEGSSTFLRGVLTTRSLLAKFNLHYSVSTIAKICLSQSAERQRQELVKLLQQLPRPEFADWHRVGQEILWLMAWQPQELGQASPISASAHPTFFGFIEKEKIEIELLNAILACGQYDKAKTLYTDNDPPFWPASTVEDQIVTAIYSAYDNSSNGNRTRGGIKRASEILATFAPVFPQSSRLREIDHLLKATHSLSFYQLTLQHGVPFRPVNIRAQKDPLFLIDKLLEQDSRAYAKLDDLVDIGRNLVLSRAADEATTNSMQLQLLDAEHRVTFQAITSALANQDFNTAYSYITSRLLTSHTGVAPEGFLDDTSWRAAYAAGKYRPSSPPSSLDAQIAGLSKRMELLSLALTLAPGAEPLSEILGTWRRCEEEMDNLKNSALEEKRSLKYLGGEDVPGGFGLDDREKDAAETRKAMAKRGFPGGMSYEEEAPVGLFEMARGAASALRKNAFPLQGGLDVKHHDAGRQSHDLGERPGSQQDSDRVRKRDMVSNMVTSGLVSGMGWVLGAQPVDKPDQQQQR